MSSVNSHRPQRRMAAKKSKRKSGMTHEEKHQMNRKYLSKYLSKRAGKEETKEDQGIGPVGKMESRNIAPFMTEEQHDGDDSYLMVKNDSETNMISPVKNHSFRSNQPMFMNRQHSRSNSKHSKSISLSAHERDPYHTLHRLQMANRLGAVAVSTPRGKDLRSSEQRELDRCTFRPNMNKPWMPRKYSKVSYFILRSGLR